MRNFFRQDNPFNNVMTKVFDLLLLNVLWLICCIPVITAGASTTALFYMTLKMVRDEEGEIMKGFFKSFKANFRQSLPITTVLFLAVGMLAADFHILGRSAKESEAVLYGGCVALLVIVIVIFSYVFPLLARFKNTVKNTFRNAGKIAVTHLPQTLLILIINCVPFLWLMISAETFAAIFWIWFFIGTSASAYLDSLFLVRIFDEFIPQDGEEL